MSTPDIPVPPTVILPGFTIPAVQIGTLFKAELPNPKAQVRRVRPAPHDGRGNGA